MTIEILRNPPFKGNVTVSRLDSERPGLNETPRIIVPAHVAHYSRDWLCKFNQGRDWAGTSKYAPPVSKGAAFWSGWKWQMGGRTAHQFVDDNVSRITTCNWVLIQDSQIIEATLNYDIPLRPQQWRYFTGFVSPSEITALFVQLGQGEIFEMWATSSSRGDSDLDGAVFEPLPLQL